MGNKNNHVGNNIKLNNNSTYFAAIKEHPECRTADLFQISLNGWYCNYIHLLMNSDMCRYPHGTTSLRNACSGESKLSFWQLNYIPIVIIHLVKTQLYFCSFFLY